MTDATTQGISLTASVRVDYDTVAATPATLSALAGIIAAKGARDLGGVFDLHDAAILGVSLVLADGGYRAQSCSECWRQVDANSNKCVFGCVTGVEFRWNFSL